MFHIGIDPGQHTGFAVWCRSTKALSCKTLDFWQVVKELEALKEDITQVRIEDPNLNRPTFSKGIQGARQREKISQNVGENKAHAKLLIAYCELLNIPVVPVKPTKHSRTKVKADAFKQMTGYTGKTSEHARDAALLVFNL